MNKEFIPYEQALALKELGFDEPCFATYNIDNKVSRNPSHDMEDLPIEGQPYYWNNSKIHKDTVTAPLYQQAFRWFREKHSLFHVITIADLGKYEIGNPDFQSAIYSKDPVVITNMDKCNTYEEAEIACLNKLIEIVKEKL